MDDVMILYHKLYSYPLPKHIHTSDYYYVVPAEIDYYVLPDMASCALQGFSFRL